MSLQDISEVQNSAENQVLHENSSKHKFSNASDMARGAGFEPARPNGPQA